jgi:hypothetical protein
MSQQSQVTPGVTYDGVASLHKHVDIAAGGEVRLIRILKHPLRALGRVRNRG